MEAESTNYVDMSLDDVIKNMKARKALEDPNPQDNSPLFRMDYNKSNNRNSSWKPKPYWKRRQVNDRSNFINHMARKRLQMARKTCHVVDLRKRLNMLRSRTQSSPQDYDLRWKIVANMIAKMREAAQAQQSSSEPFLHQRPQILGGNAIAVPQPRVSRSSLSRIERLVGKLPPWMIPKNQIVSAPAPVVHHHFHHVDGATNSFSKLIYPPTNPNEGGMNAYDGPPPLAYAPPQSRNESRQDYCSSEVSNNSHYSQSSSRIDCGGEMPPLAHAPPIRAFRQGPQRHYSGDARQDSDEIIEYVVTNDCDETHQQQGMIQKRSTLNERFSH